MPEKQRKITEVLMQCREYRCGWIGQVGECDVESLVAPNVPKILLIKKEFEGLLKCPKCGAVVSQIGEG